MQAQDANSKRTTNERTRNIRQNVELCACKFDIDRSNDCFDMRVRINTCKVPNMSAPPRRCWVGNAASSVCAVGQRTHPAEVQSEPHLPSDVVLGQLVTERIGLENGIVLSFSS